jgi:hypothetical protein
MRESAPPLTHQPVTIHQRRPRICDCLELLALNKGDLIVVVFVGKPKQESYGSVHCVITVIDVFYFIALLPTAWCCVKTNITKQASNLFTKY